MAAVLTLAGIVGARHFLAVPPPVRHPPSSARNGGRVPLQVPALVRPGFISGVVEGYYGTPWSAAATRAVLTFMAQRGFTTFVYAPKLDPYARAKWNVPYPQPALEHLAALVTAAKAHHIGFVYSISPGLNIVYSNPADRSSLLKKVRQVEALGVSTFMLSFDDVPTTLSSADASQYPGGLGQAQSALADWLIRQMQGDPHFRLFFTPTYYDGLTNGPYWEALHQDLDPGVDVLWTGPLVLSPQITAREARTFSSFVGHPVVIWDNYPVNDYTYVMEHAPRLFLGPVEGRRADLPGSVAGILANPMIQANASEVALFTLSQYLAHPQTYDPATAFATAVAKVGQGAVPAFRLLAEDSSSSFLGPSLSPLPPALQAYEAAPGTDTTVALTNDFQAMAAVDHELHRGLRNQALYAEVEPWAAELSREGQAGLQALTLLAEIQSGAPTTAALQLLKADLGALEKPPVVLDTTKPVLTFVQQAVARAGS